MKSYTRILSVFNLLKRVGFALLLLLGGVISNAHGQDSLGMQRVGALKYWQGADDIEMVGDTAYIAGGSSGLHIIDLSNPVSPTEIGHVTWYDWGNYDGSVSISGNLAFVCGAPGIRVFDISVPSEQVIVGNWVNVGIQHPMNDITVFGDLAIVSADDRPEVWDVQDLDNMHYVGSFNQFPGAANRPVGMIGDYLLLTGIGLHVWDLSDPSRPSLVTTIPLSTWTDFGVLIGDYAYLSTRESGMYIFDVSDPTQPSEVGQFDDGICFDVAVTGSTLLVSKGIELSIWSVADPLNPLLEGSLHIVQQTNPSTIACSENIACVATALDRMAAAAIDFTNRSEPILASRFGTNGALRKVAVADSVGYLIGVWLGTLTTLDFSDPTNPVEFGSVQPIENFANDVGIKWPLVYAANQNDGLTIIDVSDPLNPDSISGIFEEYGKRLEVQGDYMYVVGETMKTYSLANPASPQLVSTVNDGMLESDALCVTDSLLLLGSFRDFRIYSLSNPGFPQFVGSLHLPYQQNAFLADIVVSNGFAYLAYNVGGLRIVDISNPSSPVEISTIPGEFVKLAAIRNVLVAREGLWLNTYDISVPNAPTITGWYNAGEYYRQIIAVEPYVIAVNYTRMDIFECDALTIGEEHAPEWPHVFALSAFPNPFNSTLSISLDVPLHQEVTVSLYDLLGREVDVIYHGKFDNSTLSYTAPPTLASGIYFLHASTSTQTQMQKVVLLK